MTMKWHHLGFVVIALPQLALAELPADQLSLGTVQAAIDFCTQLKPDNAAKYQEQAGFMLSGLSEDDLAKLRSASDYQKSYASTQADLRKIEPRQAAETCDKFLTADEDRQASQQAN